jgi:hypothetical protein
MARYAIRAWFRESPGALAADDSGLVPASRFSPRCGGAIVHPAGSRRFLFRH